MVVNLEIISAIGGSATDLASGPATCGAASRGPGRDRPAGHVEAAWKHGVRSGPSGIRAAETFAREAWTKLQNLRQEAELLLQPIEEQVRQLPVVKNAKQIWEFHMNRLAEMITDLPKATQLRSELTQLGAYGRGRIRRVERCAGAVPCDRRRATCPRPRRPSISEERAPARLQPGTEGPQGSRGCDGQARIRGAWRTRFGSVQRRKQWRPPGHAAAAGRDAQSAIGQLPQLERSVADRKAQLEALKKQLDGASAKYADSSTSARPSTTDC